MVKKEIIVDDLNGSAWVDNRNGTYKDLVTNKTYTKAKSVGLSYGKKNNISVYDRSKNAYIFKAKPKTTMVKKRK